MKQHEYEALVDMFEGDGWKYFLNSVTELEDIITKAAADNAVTNDQWQYCRGQTHQLRSVIGYENYIKMSYDEQERVKEEEAKLAAEAVNVDSV